MRFPALPLLAALLAWGPALTSPADASWTVTCSQGGRIVYLEEMAESASPRRESEIVNRFPDGTCVFLSGAPPLGLVPSAVTGSSDASLDAALRAISGMPVGIAAPEEPARIRVPGIHVDLTPDPAGLAPASASWVRLAVYRDVAHTDAIADWRRIIAAEPAFRRLTPAITETNDGYMMLSVGPVSGPSRERVCLAAARLGVDCMPGRSRPLDDGIDLAVELLSMVPNGPPGRGVTESCQIRDPFAPPPIEGQEHVDDTTCWRSRYHLPEGPAAIWSRLGGARDERGSGSPLALFLDHFPPRPPRRTP